ncbi:MAG: hypothetical protein ABEK84_10025 [Salinibacter sp.]
MTKISMLMLTDDTRGELREAVRNCDEARNALVNALEEAEAYDGDATAEASVLESVGTALGAWRDAQERFMAVVEASGVSDAATAALLLKTNHGIDASNARCGLPGTDVEGADQPFPLDLSGSQGMILTQAATEHLS